MRRHVVCLMVVCLAGLAAPTPAAAQRLIFLARPPPRPDSGAMTPDVNPPLSVSGHLRAQHLASILHDAGVQAIVVTEYLRTQQTGQPLATALSLAETPFAAADTAGLVAWLARDHAADVVLVVAHSNTMPAIVAAYGGPPVTIRDDEYDNLFVIVPAAHTVSRLRY